MESKIKDIVLNHSKIVDHQQPNAECLEMCELSSGKKFEENIDNLLKMLAEVRYVDRPLKKAYIDEELQLTGLVYFIYLFLGIPYNISGKKR